MFIPEIINTYCSLLSALNYSSLILLLVLAPKLVQMMYFASDESFTNEVKRSIAAVYSLLIPVPGVCAELFYSRILKLQEPGLELNDTSVLGRMGIFLLIIIAAAANQDPFVDTQMFLLLMLVVDVLGGVLHGCTSPEGLMGIYGTFLLATKNGTPIIIYNTLKNHAPSPSYIPCHHAFIRSHMEWLPKEQVN